MRTHLGCTGRVELGALSEPTQRRLEEVEANWLEFSPEPASLEVRHVQPDDTPALREITGELLEFLSDIPDAERAKIPGGAFYYLDEQSGQYVRLKVWRGGFLTVAWARPDYSRAQWEPYQGQTLPLVFEPYQRLNGTVRLKAEPSVANQIRAEVERPGGLYPQGEYEITSSTEGVEVTLRDVNASVLPLLRILQAAAEAGSLEGQIEVSSFRAGDLDDYGRFVFKAGEVWLVRPSLWSDAPETQAPPKQPLERAA
jgi:hypothetical protein